MAASIPAKKEKDRSPYLLFASILAPGLGQTLFGHPYKGIAFLTVETTLLGMGINENERNTAFHENRLELLRDSASTVRVKMDSLNSITVRDSALDTEESGIRSQYFNLQFSAESREGEYINSTQIRNMNYIWAGGLYAYSLMDAMEMGKNRHAPPTGPKSPRWAVWSSIFVPGAGQIYNGSLGKAGMIWMAQTAFGMSAYYRHGLTRFYEGKMADAASDSEMKSAAPALYDKRLKTFTDRRNYYRSSRNSFIWYSLATYFYSVIDALVDAHLHDFDDRMDIAFHPDWINGGVHLKMSVPIRAPFQKAQGSGQE